MGMRAKQSLNNIEIFWSKFSNILFFIQIMNETI